MTLITASAGRCAGRCRGWRRGGATWPGEGRRRRPCRGGGSGGVGVGATLPRGRQRRRRRGPEGRGGPGWGHRSERRAASGAGAPAAWAPSSGQRRQSVCQEAPFGSRQTAVPARSRSVLPAYAHRALRALPLTVCVRVLCVSAGKRGRTLCHRRVKRSTRLPQCCPSAGTRVVWPLEAYQKISQYPPLLPPSPLPGEPC